MQQKIQDMIGGFSLKEFLENAKDKIDEWLTAVGMKAAGKDPGMTEEQAAQTSADYWSKRAALESDNPDVQTKAVEAACGSVRRWRIADGDLRRPAGIVLHVTWAALAGRGIDRHDAGALLYGDCHAGDE